MYSSEGCIKVKVKYTRFQIPVETVKSLCNKLVFAEKNSERLSVEQVRVTG